MRIALKVDVDTLRGYLEGVPRLLRLMDRRGIRGSFFFSFGPDNSGKAVRRIFRKGFISKMVRTNAPGTYGLKTMMYGTLLPAPMIVPSDPSILKEVAKSGQDTGIHSWDHVEWQDRLDRLSESKIESLLRKAGNMYRKVLGTPSLCCAAPAWKTSLASLSVQDRMGLLYASDSRGESPFLPSLRGRVFRTPQIPTTLPTMDEILGRDGCTADNVNDIYISLLTEGLNVHTVHAEMEGMSMLSKLDELVKRAKSEGAEFVTLKEEAAKLNKEELPICEMIQREIPGRAGAVSLQGGR